MFSNLDQYVLMYLSLSFNNPRVIAGHGDFITKYPFFPRTELPLSSTISKSIPGTGMPTVDGFNFIPGNTDNIAPPISVPPDKFIMGIFLFPTFSNSHHQESSSNGSPVVGIFRNLSNEYLSRG